MDTQSKESAQTMPDMRTNTQRRHWWNALEPQWQLAFREMGLYSGDSGPSDEQLQTILNLKVLRLAGPKAPFPNLSFALTNLSGVSALRNLEILIAINHAITNLSELRGLASLRSLFVYDNALQSLEGIQALTGLESLVAHNNQIESLAPLRNLIRLKEVNVSGNELRSLEGLHSQHADTLKNFVCKPNEPLPQREIIRVENQLGIRCK